MLKVKNCLTLKVNLREYDAWSRFLVISLFELLLLREVEVWPLFPKQPLEQILGQQLPIGLRQSLS